MASVNIAYLFGGIIMLNRRIISWHIPLAFLTSLIVCSLVSWLIMPSQYASPTIHLFSGATMLGGFFYCHRSCNCGNNATQASSLRGYDWIFNLDHSHPVTAATMPRRRLLYRATIGFLIWIIHIYGGYPDAIAFAVLLANIAVPLIDRYTQPLCLWPAINKELLC